ncbi:hypothetical protein P153DRAFT_392987 [Dothidotthia symphoricarpi CBS 119687]|uniref:DUF7580 domain-containing protein n=1 Tax=Dothidotthia symphoricarpi CBS 119687 TaxID=1392245 RepID=A0A6A6AQA7_9PLEO|nr:uncharacterized protein P153DRAFT_392987 [Dothidotthia symphoricarpi CBS 119687]KAF2133134.1 hypothetical protein P153DRAFT_392987 [Dothidotthia symphoricarpi CBS 119687]
MSGVEIAGLALAVLPVLVVAIDQIKAQRLNPRRAEFMENLAFEITFLQMSLTKLAKSLSELPNGLREKLLSPQPTQDLEASWKTAEVVRTLHARLGPGHETFFVALAAILECLDGLLERRPLFLSSDETILAPHTYAKLRMIRDGDSTPINSLNSRLRFAFEARQYNQILNRITNNNARLEKIVGWSSDSLFVTPESPKESRTIGSPHIQLRPLMHTLYEALGESWPCDCHGRHEARLCLLQYRDRRRDSMTSDTGGCDNVYFNLLVSLANEGNEPYCRWLESQLCIALHQDLALQPTHGVRFVLDATPSSVDSGVGVEMTTIPSRATATRNRIETLCHTLLQAERSLCSPKLLFDGGCLWHVSSRPSPRSSLPTLTIQAQEVDASLASLLRGDRKLRLKEKRILSVILANSLLHFCESPWLSKKWSKEHISFFVSPGQRDLEIRRPYLSTRFQDIRIEDESDALYRLHPNPAILALGILLLEIELNSPIEHRRGDEDLNADGTPTINTDHFAALRLFEDMSDDLYVNYQQAVSACLNCDFYDEDTMEPSLDNPDFRQAVYKAIVRPLEQELHSAYELTLDDLGLDLV